MGMNNLNLEFVNYFHTKIVGRNEIIEYKISTISNSSSEIGCIKYRYGAPCTARVDDVSLLSVSAKMSSASVTMLQNHTKKVKKNIK